MTRRHRFEPGELVTDSGKWGGKSTGIVLGYRFAHGPTVHWLEISTYDRQLVPGPPGYVRDHADRTLRPVALGSGMNEIPYELSDAAVALQMKARLS